VPQDTQGRWFPLSAGYRRRCIAAIEECLAEGKRRADSFFPSVVVHSLATENYPEATFANINSPSDLRRWKKVESRRSR
jgi:molybdopterin-guanine dinucleotide biosynthesis protein A